jgi:hypothetical protein
MRDSLVEAPAAEPVTLAEAKAYLGLTHSGDDGLVATLVAAAREQAELRARVALVRQTRDLSLDGFATGGGYYDPAVRALGPGGPGWLPTAGGAPIDVPRPPLVSVTSITYLDPSGVLQTVDPATYRIITGIPGRIVPALGAAFPATLAGPDVVTVRYVAGPAVASASARTATLLLVGFGYENRDPSALTFGYTGVGADSVWRVVRGILAPELLPVYR